LHSEKNGECLCILQSLAIVQANPQIAHVDEFSATSDQAGGIRGEVVPAPLKAEAAVQDVSPLRAWMVLMNIIRGIRMLSIASCFRSGIITNPVLLTFIDTSAMMGVASNGFRI
jgi:hypothetical protein